MKKNKTPLLSIVIPVYNVESFLEETIESFLEDDFDDFEIIAIDDCSSDNSYNILEKYSRKDERVKIYKNEKNCGKNDTVNYGLSLATGENIALFDSDDINIFGRLKKQIEFLEKNEDIDMVYGDIIVYYMEDGRRIHQKAIEFDNLNEPYDRLKDLLGNVKELSKIEKAAQILHPIKYIPASSVVFRRKIIDRGIKMDEKLENIEDLDFWLQIIGAGYKIKRLPLDTYIYRIHPGQKSKDKDKMRIAKDIIVNKVRDGDYFK